MPQYKMFSPGFLEGFASGVRGRPLIHVVDKKDFMNKGLTPLNSQGVYDENSQGAFDIKQRWQVARDEKGNAMLLNEICDWLRTKLDPEDYETFESMLDGGNENEGEGYNDPARDDNRRRRGARDEPPPFRGMPRPGGQDRYRYGKHSHVRQRALGQDAMALDRKLSRRAADLRSFYQMCPDAARIKLL